MRNIYSVESKWSKELIAAKNAQEAAVKYEKRNKKIDLIDREITKIELIGELSS